MVWCHGVTRVYLKDECEALPKLITQGAVFIYPTDTIYGIGCDATNSASVLKIFSIKNRPLNQPVSIIAPSKQWIGDNCFISDMSVLDTLPGPYTLILKKKECCPVVGEVNAKGNTLGVRIPKHWISDVVSSLGIPLVTTSANVTGKPVMSCVDDGDESITSQVDFIIDDGALTGNASTIINLVSGKVIER